MIHTFDEVVNEMANIRKDFLQAKKLNIDLREPMEVLDHARILLKKGEYDEAWRAVQNVGMQLKKKIDHCLISNVNE